MSRRANGGVIWILIAGAAMAFGFNQIMGYIMQLKFFIPSFILLVLSGYITARVLGRIGGDLSSNAKLYSILLEGFMFGLAFDLLRMRYDWVINIFKHIAVGTFFILIAMVYKSNLEKYSEEHPRDGPHVGLMRLSILWIIAGLAFGFTINSLAEAFLQDLYLIALLPFLALISIFLMITAKGDYDLLESESGIWYQLLAGGALGITIDLLLFKTVTLRDLLNVMIIFALFIITATVIQKKSATDLAKGGTKLEILSKKSKKGKKVVGTIELERKKSDSSSKTYSRPKQERSKKRS